MTRGRAFSVGLVALALILLNTGSRDMGTLGGTSAALTTFQVYKKGWQEFIKSLAATIELIAEHYVPFILILLLGMMIGARAAVIKPNLSAKGRIRDSGNAGQTRSEPRGYEKACTQGCRRTRVHV